MNRSLRATLTWMTICTGAFCMVVLVALVSITSMMHLAVRYLSVSVASVRVADEIELQLLVRHETQAPVVQGATAAALRGAVDWSERLVQSPVEGQRVAEVRDAVEAYLRSNAADAELATALSAARRLALLNVEQARQARERAALWDSWSNIAGTAAAILLLGGTIGLLIWLRRPFRLVTRLSEAMQRFSEGDLESRARETGPVELAAMARAFNATAGALVRARHRQTEYVATAVHDLRTPLAAIQLAVGYITPERPLPPEVRIRELFALIGRQLTRLNGLIGDVLNATWIEAGELELLREEFDVRAIVVRSVTLFRTLAPEHIVELSVPPEPLAFEGDRARLEQVVNNLLSNAVKYSPAGSRVRVVLSRAAGELSVAVSDEGPGVAPEDRLRIFEPYQRRSATHEQAPGTSLGLWVSRRVVEAHGGHIELTSRVDEGSTFRVVLPVGSSPPEHPAAHGTAGLA